MNEKKRKHNRWHEKLKAYLSQIVWCELCGESGNTDIAHRLKRRFIGHETEFDRLEYFMAAKLCRGCHQDFDEGTGDFVHEKMFLDITRLILDRDPGLVVGKPQTHLVTSWNPLGYESERNNWAGKM